MLNVVKVLLQYISFHPQKYNNIIIISYCENNGHKTLQEIMAHLSHKNLFAQFGSEFGYGLKEIGLESKIGHLYYKATSQTGQTDKGGTWKIGASLSLLIATITLLSFIPAKCWMAPLMPTAMYNC